MRLLRIAEVKHKTGLGRTTIYCLERAGKFPKSVPLTDSTKRNRGYLESEIDAWIESRVQRRMVGDA